MSRIRTEIFHGLCLVAGWTGFFATSVLAGEWPQWRGPQQNGSVGERAVVTSWAKDGKALLWKLPQGGRTTPILMGGRLFAITPVGEGIGRRERVLGLDAATGKKIWEHTFNVFHTDIVENRVGWTALVADPETGYVYAHGTGGEFFCFDQEGNIVWKVSMTEELGRISGYGGRLHTPIVDEDRVVVSFLSSSWGTLARPLHRYVAFDKRTGQILWWAAPGERPLDTTYSAPVTAVIDGRRMLIAGNADGNVYGMLARNGEKVWTFRLSRRGLNSSVVVHGAYAYACHSEENRNTTKMGGIVCIDATQTGDITDTGVIWRLDGYPVGYASPAIANGRLYVVTNNAKLYCIDANNGKVYWEYLLGRVGKGSPVVTEDGIIYVTEQNGAFHILRDGGDRCIPLHREVFTGKSGAVDEIFGSASVAHGRVYFMTRYAMFCLGKAGETASAEPVRQLPMGEETLNHEVRQPATLRVAPAEVTLRPGQEIQFRALSFNAAGSKSSPVNVEWTVRGVKGTIRDDGVFRAGAEQAFSAGLITASSREPAPLEASGRVRVVPRLPIREDFESMAAGNVPPGWVGVAAKTEVVEHEGGKVLRKLASKKQPSPPFMRLRGYATSPIESGYTVQADLLGALARHRFKPDMGLINSRYRLILMGMGKKLRIETWAALPRLRKDIAFPWDSNQWYRVKFEVKLEEEKARLRAKVWPRDEEEPPAWNIEATDPYPNREGSAGIYGYSTGTTSRSDGPEIFYDNFLVMQDE